MKIPVAVPTQPYDVVVGRGVRREIPALIAERAPRARQVVVLVDEAIASQPWCDIEGLVIPIAGGESSKSLAHVEQVANDLSRRGVTRQDVLIAVGGGATTDFVGVVAALYQRGMPVINVPTTVAGMSDAAIGGKTGVNIAAGKNLLGTFTQPAGVLCDLDTLSTLPARDALAGEAEMVKCWLISQRPTAGYLAAAFEERLEHAIALKAQIVAADEREGSTRALLNYGHTLAHAIEAQFFEGVDAPRHGEAVSMGLVFADMLAARLGRCDSSRAEETREFLRHLNLPVTVPRHLDLNETMSFMYRDKKAHGGLTFVLTGSNGCDVVADINETLVRGCLETLMEESR